ncbi:SusD family protein [Mariniflexile rhizosphaerae]|uniref:RagB/SusD family nutrient uptake outer membrane protein n=1 Tax=unclassified Mariniflexile TaxID=2643887 RepID=UPI000CC4C6DF|nr:RagB/SusD family nutrient uptake outer membrane protein [Mariniflexile sp. TRM1-10]AXP79593.1 SusD family protein [Mariniflexile sp. TRM1-10]PLB18571.1 MAG: RagB/SusD domain protein [Flavobacteriaceae bacterium FS1-H7996/R]
MKNNNILKRSVSILLLALTFVGCSKEFLEEPQNTSGINESVVFTSKEITQAFISGIYANYKGQWDDDISDGVNNSSPDTGGLYSMYFARMIKGSDVGLGVSHFQFDYAHENREPTYRRTNFAWFFNYQSVNYANTLITGVEESDFEESVKKEFIAIGKTIRAFHHFQIALEFAPNYNNNRSLVRLPLYTEKASGSSEGNAPVPLSDFYASILDDLKTAIPDLPTTRLGKSYINKAVAQGILARVLLVTQDDWLGASNAAKAAYGGNATSAVVSSNWGAGFNNLQDDEWIWGLFQDGSNETSYYWVTTPAVMTDHLNLSYKAAYANRLFVEKFSPSDIRNTFVKDYYGPTATKYREYIFTKFAFSFDADAPLMRKSEMVLIDAEAQYHLGFEDDARDLLFALQSARDPNAIKSTNSGQALLDEILLERRKELYGEIGVEWFDAKRYGLPITRTSPEHRVPVSVPANSDLFFLKIPQREIDANPNIDESINN